MGPQLCLVHLQTHAKEATQSAAYGLTLVSGGGGGGGQHSDLFACHALLLKTSCTSHACLKFSMMQATFCETQKHPAQFRRVARHACRMLQCLAIDFILKLVLSALQHKGPLSGHGRWLLSVQLPALVSVIDTSTHCRW